MSTPAERQSRISKPDIQLPATAEPFVLTPLSQEIVRYCITHLIPGHEFDPSLSEGRMHVIDDTSFQDIRVKQGWLTTYSARIELGVTLARQYGLDVLPPLVDILPTEMHIIDGSSGTVLINKASLVEANRDDASTAAAHPLAFELMSARIGIKAYLNQKMAERSYSLETRKLAVAAFASDSINGEQYRETSAYSALHKGIQSLYQKAKERNGKYRVRGAEVALLVDDPIELEQRVVTKSGNIFNELLLDYITFHALSSLGMFRASMWRKRADELEKADELLYEAFSHQFETVKQRIGGDHASYLDQAFGVLKLTNPPDPLAAGEAEIHPNIIEMANSLLTGTIPNSFLNTSVNRGYVL